MGINSIMSYGVIVFGAVFFAIFMPAVRGHGHEAFAPAPAPASDGTTIDQGIAYVLMFLALVLTYIIHTQDASVIF